MSEIAYITEQDSATFVCPDCRKAKMADIAKFKLLERHIRFKCKCICGHIYSTTLERRKNFRKEVTLKGRYEYNMQKERGTLTVGNISMGGIKFKLGVNGSFNVNDKIWVEFRLDDNQRSPIRREVIVKWIKGLMVGAQFVSTDQYDGLGFYLLS
jgi:hypothetical protein